MGIRAEKVHQLIGWREAELGYPCRLIRSNRRTTSIEIHDGEVVIRAPSRVAESVLVDWVEQKQAWILKHLSRQQQELDQHAIRLEQDGVIPVHGVACCLQWFVGSSSQVTRLDNGTLLISLSSRIRKPEVEGVEGLLKQWLQQEAERHLTQRIRQLSERTGLQPRSVVVKGFRRRWGQCSSAGVIALNWRLIHASAAIQDYVMIHELCHLREMNHGPAFWARVAEHCPDYARLRAELRRRNAWLDW